MTPTVIRIVVALGVALASTGLLLWFVFGAKCRFCNDQGFGLYDVKEPEFRLCQDRLMIQRPGYFCPHCQKGREFQKKFQSS